MRRPGISARPENDAACAELSFAHRGVVGSGRRHKNGHSAASSLIGRPLGGFPPPPLRHAAWLRPRSQPAFLPPSLCHSPRPFLPPAQNSFLLQFRPASPRARSFRPSPPALPGREWLPLL